MLFCEQNHRSAGWISWPAGDWREATTPPSLWNGPGWVCDQCAALICAGYCPLTISTLRGCAGGGHVVHETVCCPTSRWLGEGEAESVMAAARETAHTCFECSTIRFEQQQQLSITGQAIQFTIVHSKIQSQRGIF